MQAIIIRDVLKNTITLIFYEHQRAYTMINRRRHKRIGLEHLDIPAKTVLTSECAILDMGLQGIRLITTQWLNINSDYSIKFNLDGRLVSNKGTVKWVKLIDSKKSDNQDSTPIYIAGIEFQSVFTDDGKDIIHVLDEYSANEENRLSGMRLKIDSPGKAVFKILQEYPIRQISSGGMLVETNLELPLEKIFPWAFSFPGEDTVIRCNGRIVSRIKLFSKNQKRFQSGIAFQDMQNKDRTNLARFIMKTVCSEVKTASLY